MDIDGLMTQQGMRNYTDGQRDSLVDWAGEVRQIVQIVQARIANTEIDGDNGSGPARRRARKVSRRMSKVARLLEKAAAETEAVNAVYVREVLELPERRARELERKENRKQRLGIAASGAQDAVAKSLANSAGSLNGTPGAVNAQVTPIGQAPQYLNPTPPGTAYAFPPAGGAGQPLGNITDHFPEAL